MAKKKKSRHDENMRHKIEEAQRRKDYFIHLRAVCNQIHPDLFPMLSQKQLMALYMVRGVPFKVVLDGKIMPELLEYVNGFARFRQKEDKVPLGVGDHEISLIDYQRYLSPIEWLIRPDAPYDPEIRQDPDRFKGIPWYESFFEGREERYKQYYLCVTEMLSAITFFMSDLRYALYYTYFKTGSDIAKRALDIRHHQHIHIQPFRPERKHIRIRSGEKRRALRVAVVLPPDASREEEVPDKYRYFPLSIPPSAIGLTGLWAKFPRPVYVTEHALNRLDERTGCACPGHVQMY
ncbi:MAG: hypothetical protein LBD27_07440, partial [Tannerella sp.]|nr:hypothetical protein [Tannerella sp.]